MAKGFLKRIIVIDEVGYEYSTWIVDGNRWWCFDKQLRTIHMKRDRGAAFASAKAANCLQVAITNYWLSLETEQGTRVGTFEIELRNRRRRNAYDLNDEQSFKELGRAILTSIKRYEQRAGRR